MTLLRASMADLPAPVRAALDDPAPGRPRVLDAHGYRWSLVEWEAAPPRGEPVLLIHGVTSDSGTWWRVGPALAAAGHPVVAVDLPGHGLTGGWRGRHRFAETAEDVAAFIAAAELRVPELNVIGHSWGGMISASLPGAGVRPRRLILLDPPAEDLGWMTTDPTEVPYPSVEEALAVVRELNPEWSAGDHLAKATSLTRFDLAGVHGVLLGNGLWDAGMAALARHAGGIEVWLIRGEHAEGGLIPDELVPAVERQLGGDHVITIAEAPHSPQRTHIEATLVAFQRALGDLD
jgi:pimeloyl-ACP methyl ester carboxylesterase